MEGKPIALSYDLVEPRMMKAKRLLSVDLYIFFPNRSCIISLFSLLRCRFGGVVVLARRSSPSEIQCYAPTLEAGTYALELSLNNQDYTDRRFPFLFFEDHVSFFSLWRFLR